MIKLDSVHEHDREFFAKTVSPLPRLIVKGLLRQYKKLPDRFSANTFLRKSVKQIEQHLPNGFSGIELKCSEDNLRNMADRHANACLRLFNLGNSLTEKFPEKLLTDKNRLPVIPLGKIRNGILDNIVTIKKRYESLSAFSKSTGVKPPMPKISVKQNDAKTRKGYLAAIKRMCDKSWWLKALRKALNQKLESATHAANMVNRRAGIYASDLSVNRRKAQRDRNQKILEGLQATNENGDSFTLAELSGRNVSNPKVRRAELMTRIRGTENYANKNGLKGVLLTFTCPSKYHRTSSVTGEPNAKWGGYTPLHGQDYLNNNWTRIRAAFQRGSINPIGIRVAEPQHDGTPHWHVLLFIAPNRVNDAVDICRQYAMEEDGNEAGAKKARFDVLKIDPKIGSATGYIAKYISKNIDGSNLKKGKYGEDPITAAQRVDTWRSVWGIRQFQFIRGASVTVWREMRRLTEDKSLPEEFEDIRAAADESDWCKFNELMGGFLCPRKEQRVKPYYSYKLDIETGEIAESYFGDNLLEKLIGVVFAGRNIITRIHEWKVERIRTRVHESLGVL